MFRLTLTFLLCLTPTNAFSSSQTTTGTPTSLSAIDRRSFGAGLIASSASLLIPQSSPAQVFMDPAQYGDQELRVSAVDSVRESVRRAILKDPTLAPAFYQLALTDALSYNAKTQQFGPDGKIVFAVLSSKREDPYVKALQQAAITIIETEKTLRKKTAVTIADAIAIGGAESIESIGGPVLSVQLGRAETPRDGKLSDVPIDLLSGKYSNAEVSAAFQKAGMTEREMTALLCGLLTIERVQKTRSTEDWRGSTRPKFREAGKIGRMSEFRRLTDEDIAQAELDAELEDPDDGWYIADSFGTRDDRFGQRLGKEQIDEKSFNKYLKELLAAKKASADDYGWTAELLLDPEVPTAQNWVKKYAGANLSFTKDLGIAYNSITQLGAVYTGGKYESLLKNKPRKSLNDDGLNLF